jgi:hypothetical protein
MTRLTQNLGLIALALAAIFLCGGGSGYVVASLHTAGERQDPAPPPANSEAAWADQALDRLAAQLDLDPAQRAAIAPVIAGTSETITRQRERALFQIHLQLLATHDAISSHLNPTQKARLAKSREMLHTSIYEDFRHF